MEQGGNARRVVVQGREGRTWVRGEFRILCLNKKGRYWDTVTGLTTPAGLGLYVERRNIGEGGRHRWGLTHLESGILIVHIHGTPEEAVELAELIVNLADYTAYASLSDLIAADPLWHPQLLGVKRSLAPCWMEFDDPDANDPRNMIPLNDPPAIFRLARHAAEPVH